MQVVNGYVCHDCTEVDLARKGIDPAHPKDGPFGKDKPEQIAARKARLDPTLATSGDLGTRLHALG